MKTGRALWAAAVFALATGCATESEDDVDVLDDVDGSVDGKADGAAWSRKVVSPNAEVWNGGPQEWGAGTSIAVRADGSPIIAFYSAEHFCNNGGWGTYSSDGLVVARSTTTGMTQTWTRTVEACGPTSGYWPRMRVDAMDRTHVVFASGWASGQQNTIYLRRSPTWVREEWNPYILTDYMSGAPLAMSLDASGTPTLFVDGKLLTLGTGGTKTPIFADSGMRSFFERDGAGAFHFVGSTMIPDSPTMSTARMRYASRVGTMVSVEVVRAEPKAQPLGLVIDGANRPHVLSWNPGAAAGTGELWHSVRTASGWQHDLVAGDVPSMHAALTMHGDELIVVGGGRLFRRAATATTWTASAATTITAAAKYVSAIVAPDHTLHVAFQLIGATRNNRSAPAPVYHASLKLQ